MVRVADQSREETSVPANTQVFWFRLARNVLSSEP